MTSGSPMHNERSGGNISLLQIAASAACCLNNSEREREWRGEKKKRPRIPGWLQRRSRARAPFIPKALSPVHGDWPRQEGGWRRGGSIGGGGAGGWMGDLPASTPKKKKKITTTFYHSIKNPPSLIFHFSTYLLHLWVVFHLFLNSF